MQGTDVQFLILVINSTIKRFIKSDESVVLFIRSYLQLGVYLYFIFPSRVTAGLGASWPGWWRHWMLFPSCHLESLESSASNQCAILSLWFPLPLYSIARDEHTPVATFLLGNYYCVNCILYERRWSYVSPSSDVGLCGLTTSIVLFSWTKGRTGILSCILC